MWGGVEWESLALDRECGLFFLLIWWWQLLMRSVVSRSCVISEMCLGHHSRSCLLTLLSSSRPRLSCRRMGQDMSTPTEPSHNFHPITYITSGYKTFSTVAQSQRWCNSSESHTTRCQGDLPYSCLLLRTTYTHTHTKKNHQLNKLLCPILSSKISWQRAIHLNKHTASASSSLNHMAPTHLLYHVLSTNIPTTPRHRDHHITHQPSHQIIDLTSHRTSTSDSFSPSNQVVQEFELSHKVFTPGGNGRGVERGWRIRRVERRGNECISGLDGFAERRYHRFSQRLTPICVCV